jgi:DNA-binding MarR family transcriptional regulator
MDTGFSQEASPLTPMKSPDVCIVVADALVLATRLQHVLQFVVAQAMRDADVNLPQWLVLHQLLDSTGGTTLTALAAAIDQDLGSLSRSLYRLRQRQLVTTLAKHGDRRKVWLELSPAGRELCNSVEGAMRRQLGSAVDELQSRDAVDQMTSVMDRATAALRDAVILLLEHTPQGKKPLRSGEGGLQDAPWSGPPQLKQPIGACNRAFNAAIHRDAGLGSQGRSLSRPKLTDTKELK